jgi:hypothetical protein
MKALRAIGHVVVLTLAHAGITLAIGAVLLLGAAGWLFLTGAAP